MAISNNDFQKAVKLHHLRVIAALSDLKLLARVAEELNITQPAVSKQIAELEKIVGVPIVTRDRNRLFLTPTGHPLFGPRTLPVMRWSGADCLALHYHSRPSRMQC